MKRKGAIRNGRGPGRGEDGDAEGVVQDAAAVSAADRRIDSQVVMEFGGPAGTGFMMAFFPALMVYLWVCIDGYDGALSVPTGVTNVIPWAHEMIAYVGAHAAPTVWAWNVYWTFVILQAVLAVAMPGPTVRGLPVPSLGGARLSYLCNGVSSFYATLLIAAALHVSGVFPLWMVVENTGPLMTVSILSGFAVTVATYAITVARGASHRMSGNVVYDLFMGAPLNPRIGPLDLKMFAEIRVPWLLLFFISLSAVSKQIHDTGSASPSVWFMMTAHLLYVNACMKGEECIPTTWDIFYEKWGFMLIFWNMSGVPFTYCYSTLYLVLTKPGRELVIPTPLMVALFVVLFAAYYVWDTANSQKNRFRMEMSGTYIPRQTFPQLPWGTITDPEFIQTKNGSKLLVSGWWGIARKIHYTADLVMALTWGVATGFASIIPYFYVTFFTFVLVHRVSRDMERCAKKYGKDWDEYCRRVPYIFVPYVI